ncbi:hypothetical protein FOMPIDRAFT_1026690 [Fomitopsis schrenkii]|uniref:Uncharacterized protein n=1 Tax=Fomitopsis schrenkii TaxID=2126942 RepID=S8ESW3_FOMSC|nr:hypothetical protein FOMPIDRAFT_1026690 [Fomitopsis schrenkii]
MPGCWAALRPCWFASPSSLPLPDAIHHAHALPLSLQLVIPQVQRRGEPSAVGIPMRWVLIAHAAGQCANSTLHRDLVLWPARPSPLLPGTLVVIASRAIALLFTRLRICREPGRALCRVRIAQ